jgi:hypothetical protein
MKIFISLFLALLFTSQSFANDSKLIELTVNSKNKDGKDLVMTFKEEKRADKSSLVSVKYTSGASVPSSMFIAKGMYKIAKSRNALYFVNLKEWKAENGKRYYIIGFSNNGTIDIESFFSDVVDKTKKPLLISARQFELLWGNEQP